eukprot:4804259-Alexandrium_andersonii.AAC.1
MDTNTHGHLLRWPCLCVAHCLQAKIQKHKHACAEHAPHPIMAADMCPHVPRGFHASSGLHCSKCHDDPRKVMW